MNEELVMQQAWFKPFRQMGLMMCVTLGACGEAPAPTLTIGSHMSAPLNRRANVVNGVVWGVSLDAQDAIFAALPPVSEWPEDPGRTTTVQSAATIVIGNVP